MLNDTKNLIEISLLYLEQNLPISQTKLKQYSKSIFVEKYALYKFYLTYRYISTMLPVTELKAILQPTYIQLYWFYDEKNPSISYTQSKTISFNLAHGNVIQKDYINTQILIHELGHVFYNQLENPPIYSDKLYYASSGYQTNKEEVFAENFKNYFLEPKYLTKGWEIVYTELDHLISDVWKSLIRDLLGVDCEQQGSCDDIP